MALARINDYSTPLDMVFLDIDMRGSTEAPKGSSDAGYKAYEAVLNQVNVRDSYNVAKTAIGTFDGDVTKLINNVGGLGEGGFYSEKRLWLR